MHDDTPIGELIPFIITRFRDEKLFAEDTRVAAEVPLTFDVNDREIATLMCNLVSAEIVHKARRLEIPVLTPRGAPTHQNILLAQAMGIPLMGFVRPTNFAVFTHARRISENGGNK
jgi:formate dehydrogenase assembly factor FdhD